MKQWLALLLVLPAFAADPQLVFTKEFPGSKPAFVYIKLSRAGDAIYKEAPDDDQPVKFKVAPADVEAMFTLADKLDHFTRPLESGLKIARMGNKTFRWEDGVKNPQVQFNYSQDPDAQALQDWFERIVDTEQRYFELDRAVHYDKLGVQQALLLFQILYEKHRAVAPDQFLPLLDRIAKNETFIHMSRERAASLADSIRAQSAPKVE